MTLSYDQQVSVMLRVVQDAAGPALPEWATYLGCRHAFAIFHVKEVVRTARKLKLLPRFACCDGNDPACHVHGVAASNARQNARLRAWDRSEVA